MKITVNHKDGKHVIHAEDDGKDMLDISVLDMAWIAMNMENPEFRRQIRPLIEMKGKK